MLNIAPTRDRETTSSRSPRRAPTTTKKQALLVAALSLTFLAGCSAETGTETDAATPTVASSGTPTQDTTPAADATKESAPKVRDLEAEDKARFDAMRISMEMPEPRPATQAAAFAAWDAIGWTLSDGNVYKGYWAGSGPDAYKLCVLHKESGAWATWDNVKSKYANGTGGRPCKS